jgi:branched-chain amino acid transport system ATP-binding protein
VLIVRDLNVFYGKLHVLWDLSIEVTQVGSVGLFGPNGAGKTTLINSILGVVKPVSGDITFEGESLLPLKSHEIIRRGIAIVPQERDLFPLMTVRENLKTGSSYVPRAADKVQERLDFVLQVFPGLKDRLKQPAGTLSGGWQRACAIARALMADPKLLILDEPSGGLQPNLVSDLFARLGQLKKSLSILVAEQNVRQALKAIDRGYVIENGRISLADDAAALAGNDQIRRSYLGI